MGQGITGGRGCHRRVVRGARTRASVWHRRAPHDAALPRLAQGQRGGVRQGQVRHGLWDRVGCARDRRVAHGRTAGRRRGCRSAQREIRSKKRGAQRCERDTAGALLRGRRGRCGLTPRARGRGLRGGQHPGRARD